MKIENKQYYYNNIAWNFITNAFKIQLSDIPKDFYSVMSKCAYFNIHYKNNIDIKIGEPSVSELINKSFPYNILPYTIIKIATVSNYGDILYSNHSGSFFIYYIKKFSTNLEDFIYLCDSFNQLPINKLMGL